MNPRKLNVSTYVVLAVAFFVAGCGGSTPPVQPISVAITGGSLTIVPNGTFLLTATVSGDSSGQGVTWSLNGAGALSLETSTSATYTAPASVPSNMTVTVSATSIADGTKASELEFSIVAEPNAQRCQPSIAPRGNESELNVPIAFLLKGSEADETPIAYAGSFTPDGEGGITAGDVDVVGFDTGAAELPVNAKVSSYSYAANGRGCVNLQFEASNAQKTPATSTRRIAEPNYAGAPNGLARQAAGVRKRTAKAVHAAGSEDTLTSLTFSFVLSSPTGPGRIIDFANGNGDLRVVAGQMHAQSPADFSVSKLSAHYAFGADGWLPAAPQDEILRAAVAGSFTNSAGNWSLGVADQNIGGTVSSAMSGGEGGVDATIDSATGRGTGSYETGKSGVDFDFTYYIVDSGDFYFISNDNPSDTVGILAGRALAAAATSSPLDGYYITASSGLGFCESCGTLSGNTPSVSTMHAASTGSATGTTLSGNPPDPPRGAYTWSYTFDAASGRVAFTGASPLPVAYVTSGASDDGVVAFTVGTDESTASGFIVSAGTSAPNYSAASLSGAYAYGTSEDVSAGVGAAAGVVTFDGGSGFTGLEDTVMIGDVGTAVMADASSSGSYVVNSDGTGMLGSASNQASTLFVTNGNLILAFNNSAAKEQILEIYIKQTAQPAKTNSKSK